MNIDNEKTFKRDATFEEWTIKQVLSQIKKIKKKVLKENTYFEEYDEIEEDEPEWPTGPITSLNIIKGSEQILVTAGDKFEGSLYMVSLKANRPIKLLKGNALSVITQIAWSPQKTYLITGTKNGHIQLRFKDNLDKYMNLCMNGNKGHVTSVQMNHSDKLLLCSCSDGTLFLYQIDSDQIEA